MYGNLISYYPNGKLYFILNYSDNNKLLLVECRDSIGNKLAQNGNGQWINYTDDFKKLSDKGTVIDSMAEGKWNDHIYYDTVTYSTIYKHNVIVATNNPHLQVGSIIFTRYRVEISATFAGPGTFDDFVLKNLEYSGIAKENHLEGIVNVSFITEPDGTVSNVKALDGPDETMKAEAIHIVSLTHWHPHVHDGSLIEEQLTMPVNFSLDTNKVYTSVERQAQFNGSYIDFLAKNVKYPKEEINNHIQGKVVVQFVVEKDGTLSHFKILRSLSPAFDAEVLRVLALMPKFTPGSVGGKLVRSYFTMPVYFGSNQ